MTADDPTDRRRDGRAVVEVAGLRVVLRRATVGEILALRHAELRPGLPRASAEFDDDTTTTTRHFGAFVVAASDAIRSGATVTPDGTVSGATVASNDAIACVSFMERPYGGAAAYQLRGMATRADLARRGIGSALLQHALAELVTRGDARRFWCNARLAAVPFYRRMGWEPASDVFDIPSVGPHRVMTLAATGG